ncbi:reverse transcriptase domain-containing protein [Cronobacter sakazakii]|uniref:reverse transcriptase domain-containing protein n=1 Tax=Cronobacter sakazakii TaxID=28141 RepID=UPI000CFBBCB7|nr:reverse transcriptase domain-containing protein [Cronobacter sakazakii]ELY4099889.1 RNA-dependent DNA polymerase [Cronobacter sakazakii]ELY4873045.1 RNA-dependent DNA polymerase [Cronobacter sakazakii]ELY5911276.1 RNA-dependent DNA polymerase [Cronobacter sakazakii]ELY6128976.1 RNA-dependent DNA polymerase [Cronobacter sakazakii]MDT3550608.1 reverse transcriptase domain-containing protein [Cronobacter sakazakii]
MSSSDIFKKHFKVKNLRRIYKDIISLSPAIGVDNMSHEIFCKLQSEELKTIKRKSLSGAYKFNKYKLKLISKGRGKAPREISIPTIRDKIALRAMCDFLQEVYKESVSFDLPQDMVVSVKNAILEKKYDYFIKFDVSNFYPSVVHDKLIRRLRAKIRDEKILSIINSAITSPTVSKPKRDDPPTERGIPQGLSISNILAAIYLLNIDRHYRSNSNIKYYRYVDDVMILCDSSVAKEITYDLITRFKRLGLNVYDPIKHPEKSSVGYLNDSEFGYLGYYFYDGKVTARKGSVENLRESLLAIFTGYKHSKLKSAEFLEWRVNLRITGCIFQNKSKGWMYFFSEINDETLLHELDDFLKRLCVRYGVALNLKSFVRTFFQIKYNRRETNYIPNFDEYDISQKSHVLTHYFNKDVRGMTEEQINYHFNKRIAKQVKDIETDVKDASY